MDNHSLDLSPVKEKYDEKDLCMELYTRGKLEKAYDDVDHDLMRRDELVRDLEHLIRS